MVPITDVLSLMSVLKVGIEMPLQRDVLTAEQSFGPADCAAKTRDNPEFIGFGRPNFWAIGSKSAFLSWSFRLTAYISLFTVLGWRVGGWPAENVRVKNLWFDLVGRIQLS